MSGLIKFFVEEEVYKSLGNSQKNLFEKLNDGSAEKDEILEYNWEKKNRGEALDTEEVITNSKQAGKFFIQQNC